jgi:hypothetical protein
VLDLLLIENRYRSTPIVLRAQFGDAILVGKCISACPAIDSLARRRKREIGRRHMVPPP